MNRALDRLNRPVSAAPLIVFRISFGLLMAYSHLRFYGLGWVADHFSGSKFYFKYYGFEWVEPAQLPIMYGLNFLLILMGVWIALGFFYRFAAAVHLIVFAYFQLCDLSYYLNHYYFVLLVNLLMLFLPADAYFSYRLDIEKKIQTGGEKTSAYFFQYAQVLFFFGRKNFLLTRKYEDVFDNKKITIGFVPIWSDLVLKAMIGIVYFYAGIAKINYDWLIEAFPLSIWLPAHQHLPFVGFLMGWRITAYVFSWFGMLYDTLIPFFLWNSKTSPYAYILVVVFHISTGILFQIGIFPLVMIVLTVFFLPIRLHEWILKLIAKILYWDTKKEVVFDSKSAEKYPANMNRIGSVAAGIFFAFQVLFPFRYLLYPGNLFWTEEGYRFSWRVMLMEKSGSTTFYVIDPQTGREGIVENNLFLKPHQEKQMSFQPDMIVQFGRFLSRYYTRPGYTAPRVRVEAYITLNGRKSRLLIDPNIDVSRLRDGWQPKKWIIHYPDF